MERREPGLWDERQQGPMRTAEPLDFGNRAQRGPVRTGEPLAVRMEPRVSREHGRAPGPDPAWAVARQAAGTAAPYRAAEAAPPLSGPVEGARSSLGSGAAGSGEPGHGGTRAAGVGAGRARPAARPGGSGVSEQPRAEAAARSGR